MPENIKKRLEAFAAGSPIQDNHLELLRAYGLVADDMYQSPVLTKAAMSSLGN